MDRQHFEPTMTAIDLKYDILLEKPIAPTKEECLEITKAAKKNNVKIVICTVLRYTSLFITLKDIIDSGKIGKVISINHEECVGNIHQTHSFVRGNWGNSERSSFMNMPILQYAGEIRSAILLVHGEKAHSRYFSEGAYEKLTGDNKELMIIPEANHVDLYDNLNVIPFEKLRSFFEEYLK